MGISVILSSDGISETCTVINFAIAQKTENIFLLSKVM